MNSTHFNQRFVQFDEPFGVLLFINIVTIISSCAAVLSTILFILIIVFNRSLRTVANILTVNSSVAILLLASDTFSIAVYVLYRDVKRRHSSKSVPMNNLFLCHLRGYIAHVSFCTLIYSYVIQALYRLVCTIFYHRISFQHRRIYVYAIGVQWCFGIMQLLPIAIGKNQIFIEEEYLCQIAMENSKAIGYLCVTNYLIPLTIIMIIYAIIARSIQQRGIDGAYRYNIHRTRRQIVLTRRIFILIAILLILGGPYSTFIILEALSIRRAPSYSHRIGFMGISTAAVFSILTIIYFTRPVRKMIKKLGQRDEEQQLNTRKYLLVTYKRTQEITIEETRNFIQSDGKEGYSLQKQNDDFAQYISPLR